DAHEAAPRHEDQGKRHVGNVIGQHVRRVGDLEPALLAVSNRDAVVADAENGDDLETRQRVEQRGRRYRAAALNQSPNRRTARCQQARLVRRLIIVMAAVVGLQWIVEKRRQWSSVDDVGLHWKASIERQSILVTAVHSRRPPVVWT